MKLKKWFTDIRRFLRSRFIHKENGTYYINGADVLPQPLEAEEEAEALETVAMVVAEMIAAGGLEGLSRPGVVLDLSIHIILSRQSSNHFHLLM